MEGKMLTKTPNGKYLDRFGHSVSKFSAAARDCDEQIRRDGDIFEYEGTLYDNTSWSFGKKISPFSAAATEFHSNKNK